jgi:predicted DNA-binding protein with PD1-like motif
VNQNAFPPDVGYYVIEEPAEVGSISGLIVDYMPHLHIDIGVRDNETYNGHLEPDSIVLYLAEVCILKFNDVKMKRVADPKNNIALLAPS